MTDRDPYRDDRPTLVAETERLRRENAALKGALRGRRLRWFVALGLLTANVVGFVYIPDLINARVDARVYAGALALVVLFAADAWFAVRWFAQRASEDTQ